MFWTLQIPKKTLSNSAIPRGIAEKCDMRKNLEAQTRETLPIPSIKF